MPKGLDYIINIKDGDFGGTSKAKTAMEGVDTAVENSSKGFMGLGDIAGRVGGIIAGAFAVEKIIEFGKESREAFLKSEAAAAQVDVAIQKTGGIAGKSLDELREKAEALEGITLFGDEDTLGADSLLLTFTNIRGKIFDEAIPAIQDLAQRMAGDGPADLKGASIQVGKALNDPITGINALRRVGVSFSDVQRGMIEQAVKHGQVQKAQGIILQELNKEFGGSAEAARKVLGPAGDLNHDIEEMKKGFGRLINEGLSKAIPLLYDTFNGIKTLAGGLADGYHWVKDNVEIFKALGIAVGTAGAAFLIANPGVIAYGASLAIDAIASSGLAIATGVLTAAQWALNIAMDANPIGLIITGIGVLAGGLYYAYQKSETFRAVLSGIGEVASELVPIFKGVGETILGALTFNPALIAKGFADAYKGVQKVVEDGGITGAFNRGYDNSIASSKKAELENETAKKAEESKSLATSKEKPGGEGSASGLVKSKGKEEAYTVNTGGKHKSSGDDSTSLAGGKSVRNVTVTIGKLIETLQIQTTNLQGVGSADIKRQLTELLVGSVHDSELALGSQ